MQEAAEADTILYRRLEAEYASSREASTTGESTEQREVADWDAAGASQQRTGLPESTGTPQPNEPKVEQFGKKAHLTSRTNGLSQATPVPDRYPLPLAFSWSLLASLWDPRDRYSEQLRHAENMLAFLGSISLTLRC